MKPFYKSQVIWFNVAMTVVLSVPVIAAAVKAISPEWAVLVDAIGGLIMGLGNVFMRVWGTDNVPIDTPQARAKAIAARAESFRQRDA